MCLFQNPTGQKQSETIRLRFERKTGFFAVRKNSLRSVRTRVLFQYKTGFWNKKSEAVGFASSGKRDFSLCERVRFAKFEPATCFNTKLVFGIKKAKPLASLRAENGIRTRDPQLGKLMLYRLSYFRVIKERPSDWDPATAGLPTEQLPSY